MGIYGKLKISSWKKVQVEKWKLKNSSWRWRFLWDEVIVSILRFEFKTWWFEDSTWIQVEIPNLFLDFPNHRSFCHYSLGTLGFSQRRSRNEFPESHHVWFRWRMVLRKIGGNFPGIFQVFPSWIQVENGSNGYNKIVIAPPASDVMLMSTLSSVRAEMRAGSGIIKVFSSWIQVESV